MTTKSAEKLARKETLQGKIELILDLYYVEGKIEGTANNINALEVELLQAFAASEERKDSLKILEEKIAARIMKLQTDSRIYFRTAGREHDYLMNEEHIKGLKEAISEIQALRESEEKKTE